MRAILFAVALAAAPLADCSGLVASQTLADAEKALTLAHLAYQGVGVTLKNAAQSGALHGADAARAKALYDQAGAALALADKADALGNADDTAQSVAAATALIADLDTLIKN